MIKEGAGVAISVLGNRDVNLRKVRREVEKIAQPGLDMVVGGPLRQTPRASKARICSKPEVACA